MNEPEATNEGSSAARIHRSDLGKAALQYAARDIPIFACAPGTKIPLPGSHGFRDATTDFWQIEMWWAKHPDANIAFVPGSIGECVLDIEHNGETDWRDLLDDHTEKEPVTRIVRTPSGGRHIYFKGSLPGKVRIKTATGRPLNIDTRGEGSYVLLPPSRIDGHSYELVNDAEPVELPQFLAELVRSGTPAVTVPTDVELDQPANLTRARRFVADCIRTGRISIEGRGGDATLYGIACDLSDLGISEDRCAELLSGEWNQACIPPWSTEPDHFTRTISNAYQYQQNKGSGAYASRATFAGFDAAAFDAQRVGSGAVSNAGSASDQASEATIAAIPGPVSFASLKDEQPVPLQFVIDDIIPKNTLTILSAPGGTGKSMLALQWGLSVATGEPIWGRAVERSTFIHLSCEDDRGEIVRRTHRIKLWPEDDDAHYWDLTDTDQPLMRITIGGIRPTPFWPCLCDYLVSIAGHKFIVMDSTYNLLHFDANTKIDEGLVKQAVEKLNRLCRETDSTIVSLWHPSRAGMSRGDASGWAVAWDNAPRSRISLTKGGTGNKIPVGCVEMRTEKRSGGKEPRPLMLHWTDDGLLVPLIMEGQVAAAMFYKACVGAAVHAARGNNPFKRRSVIANGWGWALDEIKEAIGASVSPSEASLKAELERAVRDGLLEYRDRIEAKNHRGPGTPAGYYPTPETLAALAAEGEVENDPED